MCPREERWLPFTCVPDVFLLFTVNWPHHNTQERKEKKVKILKEKLWCAGVNRLRCWFYRSVFFNLLLTLWNDWHISISLSLCVCVLCDINHAVGWSLSLCSVTSDRTRFDVTRGLQVTAVNGRLNNSAPKTEHHTAHPPDSLRRCTRASACTGLFCASVE